MESNNEEKALPEETSTEEAQLQEPSAPATGPSLETAPGGDWNWFRVLRDRVERFCSLFSVARILSGLGVVAVACSLFEQCWLRLSGGSCPLQCIGVPLFYGCGKFEVIGSTPRPNANSNPDISNEHILYKIRSKIYVDCVSPHIVVYFEVLIVTLLFTLVVGCLAAKYSNGVRHICRMLSVLAMFHCFFALLLCYLISKMLEVLQRRIAGPSATVVVSYGQGFYFIMVAFLMFLVAFVSQSVMNWPLYRNYSAYITAMLRGESVYTVANPGQMPLLNSAMARRLMQMQYYRESVPIEGIPPPPYTP